MTTCFELFRDAVKGGRRAMLRGAVDGVNHEHQVRFLRHGDGDDAKGVWVQLVGGDVRALELEYRQKCAVEVSFSAEDAMAFFDSVIERRKTTLILRERRLLLRAPNKISIVQQRKDGRVGVPENCGLISKLARVTVDAEDDRSATILQGRLWDLSPSGASLICPVDAVLIALKQGEPLELDIEYEGVKIARTATVCYARPLSMRSVRLGVQFAKDDPRAVGDEQDVRKLMRALQGAGVRAKIYEQSVARSAG